MTLENFLAFLGASIVITLTPGPDILFSITQGIVNGKMAGLKTALGMALGNIVHLSFVLLGIAVLIKNNPLAFQALKVMGGIYLVYLAIQSFRERNTKLHMDKTVESSKKKIYFFKGFMMNVMNPKVIIFFLAFFPQFLPAEPEHMNRFILLYGGIFILQTFIIFGSLSYGAGVFGRVLLKSEKISKYINVGASIVFLGIAGKLLFL